MKVLSYVGVSALSRGIRWFTWAGRGGVNHIAWPLLSGSIVEAWKGGIRLTQHPFDGHSRRTRVFLHDILDFNEARQVAVESFLREQVGKRYDYPGLFRFPLRRDPRRWRNKTASQVDPDEINSWICSTLGPYALSRYERPLADKPWWRFSPADVVESPRVGPGAEIFRDSPWPYVADGRIREYEEPDPYLWGAVPVGGGA